MSRLHVRHFLLLLVQCCQHFQRNNRTDLFSMVGRPLIMVLQLDYSTLSLILRSAITSTKPLPDNAATDTDTGELKIYMRVERFFSTCADIYRTEDSRLKVIFRFQVGYRRSFVRYCQRYICSTRDYEWKTFLIWGLVC